MRKFLSSERPRIVVAAAVFIFCCLLSSVRILTETPAPGHHVDKVAECSDRRFAALKTALPERGIVGYVGDFSSPADYYLAQYALAPLVVDNSIDHPWVVGNFASSPPVAALPVAALDDLRLVKDFGNGVMLFAHHAAQAGRAQAAPLRLGSFQFKSAQLDSAQVNSARAKRDAK